MQTLEQQRVLVTGGSRGLGLGVVEALVARKASVTVVARDSVRLMSSSSARRLDRFGRCHRSCARRIVLRDLRPSVLVLNAGARPPWRPARTDMGIVQQELEYRRQAAFTGFKPPSVSARSDSRVLISSSGAAIEGSPLSGITRVRNEWCG